MTVAQRRKIAPLKYTMVRLYITPHAEIGAFDLSDMFGEIGEVESVQIITDRDTRRSKGLAFVQMANDAAADIARVIPKKIQTARSVITLSLISNLCRDEPSAGNIAPLLPLPAS